MDIFLSSLNETDCSFQDASGWRAGGWSKTDVVLELGGILKAIDAVQSPHSSSIKPPPKHKLFSKLEFIRGGSDVNAQQLEELDVAEPGQHLFDKDDALDTYTRQEQQGGWLDSDDIEDFD